MKGGANMINPHIKCRVSNCKHNDQSQHCCLDNIIVGNTAPTPHEKCETECDSFEEGM